MKAAPLLTASFLAFAAIPATHGDTFGTGANSFTIDFVTIGNPGNGDDRLYDDTNDTPGNPNDDEYASRYGGVSYNYRMGTYEISQDAITKATAGGLLHVTAGGWTGNQPATYMTWFEAAAFVNWLNDQKTPGLRAYDLDLNATTQTLWSSAEAWQTGGENRYRHKDAYYFLPNEDEWYKAAFHKNDGVTANYWDYATGSNQTPMAVASGTAPHTAVYNTTAFGPAAVNNNGGLSAYGTMGQTGNVWEWTETALDGNNNSSSKERSFRGGGWDNSASSQHSGYRIGYAPTNTTNFIGFRVASIPEPSSALLLAVAGGTLLLRRRR